MALICIYYGFDSINNHINHCASNRRKYVLLYTTDKIINKICLSKSRRTMEISKWKEYVMVLVKVVRLFSKTRPLRFFCSLFLNYIKAIKEKNKGKILIVIKINFTYTSGVWRSTRSGFHLFRMIVVNGFIKKIISFFKHD